MRSASCCIRFHGHTGARHSFECVPYRLEYSAKDDKFRLLATGKHRLNTINMARVRSCELLDEYDPKAITLPVNAKRNSRYCSMMSVMVWSVSFSIFPTLRRRP